MANRNEVDKVLLEEQKKQEKLRGKLFQEQGKSWVFIKFPFMSHTIRVILLEN